MRLPIAAASILLSLAVVSCADMPTAPRALVPVSGTILDRDGNPIQAAYIWFIDQAPQPKGTDAPVYHAVTNYTGNYAGMVPEGRYEIVIGVPDFTAYAPIILPTTEIGRAGLRLDHRFDWLRLAIRPSISGGQPVSALRAEIWSDFSSGFFWQVETRLAGLEREAFVPAGRYSVHLDLTGPGFGYLHRDLSGVTLSADTTLDLQFSGNVVGIHVTGPDGQPLANAPIGAVGGGSSLSTRADAAGSANLYLPTGTYRLVAYAPTQDVMGRSLANISITGNASFDFDLSGTVWTGVVRKASDGSPVEGAAVQVIPRSSTNPPAVSMTDAGGAFHVVVQSGLYHLIRVFERFGGQYTQVAEIDSVAAGADSTFDIPVPDAPVPAKSVAMPAPPAPPGAPAFAAEDPAFPRRSSRIAE